MSRKNSGRSNARERILQAALTTLEEGTAEEFEVSAVAKRAGVSRQAVYLHFKNRTELALAVARYTDEHYGLSEALAPLESADSAEALIHAYACFLADYNPRIYPVVRMAYGMRRHDPDSEAAWQDRLANRRLGAVRMAQRLRRWGRLDPELSVREAADWLAALGAVAFWEELVLDHGWSRARFVAMIERSCRRTLLNTHAGQR